MLRIIFLNLKMQYNLLIYGEGKIVDKDLYGEDLLQKLKNYCDI